MAEENRNEPAYRLAGYAELIDRYGLEVIPNWHRSLVAPGGTHRIDSTGGGDRRAFPGQVPAGRNRGRPPCRP